MELINTDELKDRFARCCYSRVYQTDTSLPCGKRLCFQHDVYKRLFSYLKSKHPEYALSFEDPLESFINIYIQCDAKERDYIESLLKLSSEEQACIDAQNTCFEAERNYLDASNPVVIDINQTKATINRLNLKIEDSELELEYVAENLNLCSKFPLYHKDNNYSTRREKLLDEISIANSQLPDVNKTLETLESRLNECVVEYTNALVK